MLVYNPTEKLKKSPDKEVVESVMYLFTGVSPRLENLCDIMHGEMAHKFGWFGKNN